MSAPKQPYVDTRLFDPYHATRKFSPQTHSEFRDQSPSRAELELLRQRKCELLQHSLNKLKNVPDPLDDLRREIERLKKCLLEMSMEVEHWKAKSMQPKQDGEVTRLRENEENLKEEIIRLRSDLDEGQRRYRQLEFQLAEQQQITVRELEANMNTLQRELERQNHHLQEKSDECLEYREKYLRTETQVLPRLQAQLREVMQDHQSSVDEVHHLKLQQREQKEEYDELISKLENIIEILKTKFQNDLRDLQTKQNVYFNQNNNIKMSLNQAKEAQHLLGLIQQYSENAVTAANNQAKLKLVQEKKKSVASQLNAAKETIKKKQSQVDSLTAENQELLKKIERYKPRVYHLQRQPNPVQQPQELPSPIILQMQEGLVAKLEGDVTTVQAKLKHQEASIQQINLVNQALEDECKRLQQQLSLLQQSLQTKDQVTADMQKQHKSDLDRVYKDLNIMQGRIVADTTVQSLQEQIETRDQSIKELQMELVRRREATQQFRNCKEEKDALLETLRKDLTSAQEEIERLRKQVKEGQRREAGLREMRERFELQKQNEVKLTEEVGLLTEKLKTTRLDLQRKEATIKELREKLDDHHQAKQTDSAKKDLKAKIKRLKEESTRKDATMKHFKTKLDEKCEELEKLKNDHGAKYSAAIHELEREQRKSEQLRTASKQPATQVTQLLFLLRRLYRENLAQLQHAKMQTRSNAKTSASVLSHYQASRPNLSRFSESMNILNISPDDLQDFLEPNTRSEMSLKKGAQPPNREEDADQFDEMFNNLDTLDINKPFQAIQALIQERMELIKN